MTRGLKSLKELNFTISDLKQLPPEKQKELALYLGEEGIEELQYSWEFNARPKQIEPKGDYSVWLLVPGRGFGKTRTGVETVRHWIKQGHGRVAAVAPTKGDVRRVMVEGESGFLNCCWKKDTTYKNVHLGFPVWSPTNNTLTWDNGAKVEFFSAEDPERLRGPQFSAAWCDEIFAWTRMQETWDMLQYTLRLGRNPKTIVTSTPKPVKLIRELIKESKAHPDRIVVTTGSSYENSENIDVSVLAKQEGTRLGRQEIHGEILDEASDALWTRALLEQCECDIEDPVEWALNKAQRVVVAVDPAVTANEESDMTGIVVAAIGQDGKAYVLHDATDRYTPDGWSKKAVELYELYQADRIVAERNQGGDMVRHTFKTVDPNIPVTLVHASRGKFARAEPVSALYEQGKVRHVKGLNDLEDQMVQWEPLGSIGSPDRLDALVWALTNLCLKNVARPELKLLYAKKN